MTFGLLGLYGGDAGGVYSFYLRHGTVIGEIMGYWKIAPGEGGFLWVEQRDNSCIAVGWTDIGSLRKLGDQGIQRALKRVYGYKRPERCGLWRFYKEVRKDDMIIAAAGGYLYGIGTVISNRYKYDEKLYYSHSKPVRWGTTFWNPLDIWKLKIPKWLKRRLTPKRGRTIMPLEKEEFDKVQRAVDKVKTPFKNLNSWEGLPRAPQTEQEVIILFSKLSNVLGMRIESVGTRFPDAVIQVKERGEWIAKAAEFEKKTSDFKSHRHNPKDCDYVICWEKDEELTGKRYEHLEVIALKDELQARL